MKNVLAILLLCPCAALAQYTVPTYSAGSLGAAPAASAPTFSPAAGAVSNPTTVTASTSTSGCGSYIYFDTSNPPTTHSTTYSVTTAVTLYAYVHGCPGYSDSTVASAAYTISGAAPVVSATSWVKDNESGGATTITVAPTTGHQLTVCGALTDSTTTWTSVVDNHSNALHADFRQINSGIASLSCFSETAPASTTSVVATPSSSGPYVGLIAFDASNMGTSPTYESVSTISTSSGSATSYTTNSVTPSFSGHNLLIGAFVTYNSAGASSWSAAGSYTGINNVTFNGSKFNFFLEWNVQIGTSPVSASASLSPAGNAEIYTVASYQGSN